MPERRVLVTGSRWWSDATTLAAALAAQVEEHGPIVVIHGAAAGADRMADNWAVNHGYPVDPYPADWAKHGRKAGPIRNRKMLAESRPDIVLAFPLPDSKGTWDMVRIADDAGVPVLVFDGQRPTRCEQVGHDWRPKMDGPECLRCGARSDGGQTDA